MCAVKYVLMCTCVKLKKKRCDMYKYILLLLLSHLKPSRFMDERTEKGANASIHRFSLSRGAQIGRRGERKGRMNAAERESCSFPFAGQHGALPHFHLVVFLFAFQLFFSLHLSVRVSLTHLFRISFFFLPFSGKRRIQTNDDNNSLKCRRSPFFSSSLLSLLPR